MVPVLHRLCAVFLLVGVLGRMQAQTLFTESFTGTTAPGWVFGGNYTPTLTANTIDTPGNGWLRLTDNANNRATYAFLDTQIFSVNAQINITMEYAFYNGSGADGITFFLVDGSINASTFDPGSYGGSLGYAQRTGEGGMRGGYLGFGFDNFGNYANGSEGRNGGITTNGTLHPNRVVVRGPESSDYQFIAASDPLPQQMDFPSSTTRPSQTGADYRAFQLVLDANNQLEVFMKFGATGSFQSVFTADLSGYDRPETFKLGFTGATGGSTEIHEIRNLQVSMTPFQADAFEWDDGAGANNSAATASNWHGDALPTDNADLLFGSKPAAHSTQPVVIDTDTRVRSLTFDSSSHYQLSGAGEITLGNSAQVGVASINVNEYNEAYARHKIDNDLRLAELLRVNNYSLSTLCLNGALLTEYDDNVSSSNATVHDIVVNGHGAVNFNGDIIGAGDLLKNGRGITTINNDNADGASPWTGAVSVNDGMLVVTADGALGSTAGSTTVADGATLALRGTFNYATTESVTISGRGFERGLNQQTGALYGDGGNNAFAGAVTLAADSAIGSRTDTLTLSGAIGQTGGARSLSKVGEGVVSLVGANTYTGNTVVEAGVLRVTTAGLPGGYDTSDTTSNFGSVDLAGGVLELASNTTFTRSVGTGEEQIFWSGDGGFSAHGGNRTVSLAVSGVANGALEWGVTSGFVADHRALLLSSAYSDATLTFTNALNLGNATREVRVANGSSAVDATLSGNLTSTGSSGGLRKTGDGTLNLTGTNTYAGPTLIQGGALRGNVSTNSNIQLDGGVRELSVSYTGNLGTGAGQLQWLSGGGIAGNTAARTFNVGNNNQALTWGGTTGNSAFFVRDGQELVLGSRSTAGLLTFDNALNLNNAQRTIRVIDSALVSEEAVLNRDITGGNLRVIGDGNLALNFNTSLAGSLTVEGATLTVRNNGQFDSVSSVTIRNGGSLVLDSRGSSTDRLANSAPVTLAGGTLAFYGRTGNTDTSETVGAITLQSGANTLDVVNNRSGRFTELTSASLTRNAGATIDFTNSTATNGTFGTGNTPRLTFTTAPTTESGILAYATVNGSSFAALSGNRIVAAATSNATQSSWTSATIAAPTSDQNLDANRTVGALVLGSGIDVGETGGARTLTVQTGGILSTGATASNITTSTLQVGGTGNRELITHVYGAGGLNIASSIQNNANTTGLTKTGTGTLTLSGTTANTYTGLTRVNAGTLALDKTDNVTAIAGDVLVGDGRGVDTLAFFSDNQLAIPSDVTLRGGLTGSAASSNNVAVISLNGTSQSFDTLTIEGNSVLDFSGGDPCAPTFLRLADINFVGDATLTIRNWIEFTDFFLVQDTGTIDFSRIRFEGYGPQAYWQDYSTGWKQLTPVPEPSTTGFLLLGFTTGCHLYRRRRA